MFVGCVCLCVHLCFCLRVCICIYFCEIKGVFDLMCVFVNIFVFRVFSNVFFFFSDLCVGVFAIY